MIVRLPAALLALLTVGATQRAEFRMTLAEANRLPPRELGKRLFGAVGESRNYVEKRVRANGGLMIHQPGLNAIDLYEKTDSAGFEGLCEVNGASVQFESSPPRTAGDPPHRITDSYQFTRFLMLRPVAGRNESVDWQQQKRDCAMLTPVADREDPGLFTVASDKPVHAYFAMRALAKVKALPVPITQIHYVDVARCESDGRHWCVTAQWQGPMDGNEADTAELTLVTDAERVDPPSDFNLVSVNTKTGRIIYD